MSRNTYSQPDCFQALTNPKYMRREEIAGFHQQFNVNLSDGEDEYLDAEEEDFADLEVIDEDAFVHRYVMGDDLFD